MRTLRPDHSTTPSRHQPFFRVYKKIMTNYCLFRAASSLSHIHQQIVPDLNHVSPVSARTCDACIKIRTVGFRYVYLEAAMFALRYSICFYYSNHPAGPAINLGVSSLYSIDLPCHRSSFPNAQMPSNKGPVQFFVSSIREVTQPPRQRCEIARYRRRLITSLQLTMARIGAKSRVAPFDLQCRQFEFVPT